MRPCWTEEACLHWYVYLSVELKKENLRIMTWEYPLHYGPPGQSYTGRTARVYIVLQEGQDIMDCRDPHIIEDLHEFREIQLGELLDKIRSEKPSIIYRDGARWNHLREWL